MCLNAPPCALMLPRNTSTLSGVYLDQCRPDISHKCGNWYEVVAGGCKGSFDSASCSLPPACCHLYPLGWTAPTRVHGGDMLWLQCCRVPYGYFRTHTDFHLLHGISELFPFFHVLARSGTDC